MLARALLAASAAIQAWYFLAAAALPRWKGPDAAVDLGRWMGLLGFALGVAGGVASVRELKGKDRMRILGRGAVAVLALLLAVFLMSGASAAWKPASLKEAAPWAAALAVLALLP